MTKEEEKDIVDFYANLERVTAILMQQLKFVNINGYVIIDVK